MGVSRCEVGGWEWICTGAGLVLGRGRQHDIVACGCEAAEQSARVDLGPSVVVGLNDADAAREGRGGGGKEERRTHLAGLKQRRTMDYGERSRNERMRGLSTVTLPGTEVVYKHATLVFVLDLRSGLAIAGAQPLASRRHGGGEHECF
jgi:hypothetical protein